MLGGAELIEVANESNATDKARFVRTVETALLRGEAEVGVHSAKDLPGEEVEGLEIAAVPMRADPADVWIGAGASLDDVPEGARVGTASLRNAAPNCWRRRVLDLRVEELHGNVDTRLRKLARGRARRDRPGRGRHCAGSAARTRSASRCRRRRWPRPPGQGSLLIQTRAGDEGRPRLLERSPTATPCAS